MNNNLTYTRCGDYELPELMKQNGVTEQLKASDPMKWTGFMNTIMNVIH